MAVYIIGAGPGDPKLLTVKAADTIASADTAYVPYPQQEGVSPEEKMISGICSVRHYRYIEHSFAPALTEYAATAEEINKLRLEGKTVVFLTSGDGTVFSTASMLASCLNSVGCPYEFIPGIPSFTACANILKQPLAENVESFSVHILPDTPEEIAGIVSSCDTAVFMKLSKNFHALEKYLAANRPRSAYLVCEASMSGESVTNLLEPILRRPDRLGVAIIRK